MVAREDVVALGEELAIVINGGLGFADELPVFGHLVEGGDGLAFGGGAVEVAGGVTDDAIVLAG